MCTCFVEGLFGFNVIDGVVFVTLFDPIFTNIGDTFVLDVLNLRFLSVYSVLF